jgi:hypothetical protein
MKNINLILTCVALSSLVACGGGGGGNSSIAEQSTFVTLRINKNGFNNEGSYSQAINTVQNQTSGYRVGSTFSAEWTGSELAYTQGYTNPTSGTLKTYKVSGGNVSELWYEISGLNYNISLSPPSISLSDLPLDALSAATETRIYGGRENDRTLFFRGTTEVDLSTGMDTLVLSQNYNIYTFSRVVGSGTSINVSREGSLTLVKNVEYFEFANGTKTLNEILASIP